MSVDVAPHALDLRGDRLCQFGVTTIGEALGVLGEDRQRRLQSVRQVAGPCGSTSHALVAVLQQFVEIPHERSNLGGIVAFQPRHPAAANGREPLLKQRKRRQATAEDGNGGSHEHGTAKRQRIIRAAKQYLRELGQPPLVYRYDIVEVVLVGWRVTEVRYWRNAFQEDRDDAATRFPSALG